MGNTLVRGETAACCIHIPAVLQSVKERVMLTPTLLIFERRPRWVPEMERQFLGQNVRVRGCRSVKDLLDRFHSSPKCLAILDLEADPEGCLNSLARLMAHSPLPTILVVASERYRDLEWPVRELGATAFLEEPLTGDKMAEWCLRQFRVSNF
jgi:DNA-binding NtrC family response regulator